MSNTETNLALVSQATGGISRQFNQEQIDLLKRTIAKGTTDDEFALFLHVCNRTGLDPFLKQIHCVKRWSAKDQREVMAIQTGIDGYRLTAQRTGEYAGNDDAVFEGEVQGHPLKATVTVWRLVNGVRQAFTASARWVEYAQTKKDGTLVEMWQRMPYGQLSKCAESLALRKAFPAELSGLNTDEEMSGIPADERKKAGAVPIKAALRERVIEQATEVKGKPAETDTATETKEPLNPPDLPSPAEVKRQEWRSVLKDAKSVETVMTWLQDIAKDQVLAQEDYDQLCAEGNAKIKALKAAVVKGR
jgi:phage recombination protein Bet